MIIQFSNIGLYIIDAAQINFVAVSDNNTDI